MDEVGRCVNCCTHHSLTNFVSQTCLQKTHHCLFKHLADPSVFERLPPKVTLRRFLSLPHPASICVRWSFAGKAVKLANSTLNERVEPLLFCIALLVALLLRRAHVGARDRTSYCKWNPPNVQHRHKKSLGKARATLLVCPRIQFGVRLFACISNSNIVGTRWAQC